MAEKSVTDKIISNTLFNSVGSAWKILLGIALTPYIVSRIGIYQYGIWAIVTVISGYFGLLDFGVGTSFVRYLSEFYTKKEIGRINQLVNTGIVFYAIFTLIIGVLAYFALGPVIDILRYPDALRSETFTVFFMGIVLLGLTDTASVIGSIQTGLQRMDISNTISILVSIPMLAGTVFFLQSGYGMIGLMWNNVIVFVITTILNLIVAYRLIPELRINPLLFSREMLKKIVNFGYKIQVGSIADTITFQTDKLLITYFMNPTMTGFYQVGSSLAQTMRNIPTLLISAILPAASEINAYKEHQKLQELYVRGTKYLMLVSFPLVLFIVTTADVIMLVWMGPDYGISALIVQILCVGYLFNLIVGIAVSIGAAIEKPEYQMNSSLITIFTNLILSVLLVHPWGINGIAVAAAVSLICGPIYYFIKFHQEIVLSLPDFLWKVALPPAMAALVPAIAIYAIYAAFGLVHPAAGRIPNALLLGASGIVYCLAYLAIILKLNCLDDYDMRLIRRMLSIKNVQAVLLTRKKN